MPSPLVEVGYVARAHGIRGELRIVTHDPQSQALFEVDNVQIGDATYSMRAARPTKGAVLVSLEEVTDRNRAEEMRGLPVRVHRTSLALEKGEVLLGDLVGCRVELKGGGSWGLVSAIQLGPQNRLVIVDGDDERLLPIVDELICEIDVDGQRITIDPPDDWPINPRHG